MNQDFRKQWFCERILSSLRENDEKLLNILLNLHGTEFGNQFDNYLNASADSDDICHKIFTVYKTFYTAIVEEEIVLNEEVQQQRSSFLISNDEKKKAKKIKSKKKSKKVEKVDTEDREVDDDLVDEDRNFKKKKKCQKKGGRSSPYTMMDNLQDDRPDKEATPSLALVKKVVQKVVELPQIQCIYGTIDENKLKPADCYVYFIKKKNQRVGSYANIEEANENMPIHFYIGSLSDDFVKDLELTLESVFIPLLQKQKLSTDILPLIEVDSSTFCEDNYTNVDKTAATRNKPSCNFINSKYKKNIDKLHANTSVGSTTSPLNSDFDFSAELTSLTRTLKWARTELQRQKKSSVYVPYEIDKILQQAKAENVNRSEETMNGLYDWAHLLDSFVSDILQSLNFPSKSSSEQKLLIEYNFWRETETKLATVADTFNSNITLRVMEALRQDTRYTSMREEVETKKITLYQLQEQAGENADILRTHSVFFETFTNGDFQAITKTIPTYIQSLKSVWMLSKYYGEEKNMLRLLQNTKSTLCNRVKTEFKASALFKCDWDELNKKLKMGKDMLLIWESSYLKTRHSIESNCDFFIRRWEFDKSILFSETEYITNILQDIIEVLKIVKQYRNLFELSGLYEIPDCKNEKKNFQRKMEHLTLSIEKADFDIYWEIFRDEWLEILEIFQQNIIEMDQHLKILIIKTFSQIKDFDKTVELVKNISKMETRPTVHDSLPYMCNKIILYFMKQIQSSYQRFEKNKENHIGKTYKVCDTISWAENELESLIQQSSTIKSMVKTVEINIPIYNEASEYYSELELKIRDYIQTAVNTWASDVVVLLKNTLTETIIEIERTNITKDEDEHRFTFEYSGNFGNDERVTSVNTLNGRTKGKFSRDSKKTKRTEKGFNTELMSDKSLIESGHRFKLKLQSEVFDVIEHFYRLNSNGLTLSNNKMKNLSLTIDLLKENINKLEGVLTKHDKLVNGLKPSEIMLLKQYLLEIDRAFLPGVEHLTWKYSSIDDYCKRVDVKCEEFAFKKHQVEETLENLDSLVFDIQNITFFPVEGISLSDFTYNEFIKNMNFIRHESVEKCQKQYEKISRTLIQLESLVLYTHTGKSSTMVDYYKHYNEEILKALEESVLQSMVYLRILFDGQSGINFNVRCYLEKNEVKIKPNCDEIFEAIKITMILLFTELENLKFWQPDSAVIMRNSTTNAIIVEKISNNEQIKSACTDVLYSLQTLCDTIKNSLTRWYKYSIMWQYNKDDSIAEFASTKPHLSSYETVYNFYTEIETKIYEENPVLNIGCVNTNSDELIHQLKSHCKEWKAKLSAGLAMDTRAMLSFLNERITKLSRSLEVEINGVQVLTSVLTTINEIYDMEIDTDIQLCEIKECLHELNLQSFMVDEDVVQSFTALESSWKLLLRTRLYRKFVLEPLTQQVIPEIKSRIIQFVGQCKILNEEYDKASSKIESFSFDDRLNWIKEFSKRQIELENQKKELQRLSRCYEVVLPEITELIEVSKKLGVIKCEYKV